MYRQPPIRLCCILASMISHSQRDVPDPEMLSTIVRESKVGSLPDLSTLTPLDPLHGHFPVIYVCLVFLALITKEQQLHLKGALGLCSSICDVQVSVKERGNVTAVFGSSKPSLLLLHGELDRVVGWNGVQKGRGSSLRLTPGGSQSRVKLWTFWLMGRFARGL
ncbi:hypothetical protein BKA83DRAFT_2075919 [Pisolithus microcarpus]|nr:hypothetical protein BKA83DRAFT_2075919 [Pisolithus microcarpus]